MLTLACLLMLGVQAPNVDLISEALLREAGFTRKVRGAWHGYEAWLSKRAGASHSAYYRDPTGPRTISVRISLSHRERTTFTSGVVGPASPMFWEAGQPSGLKLGFKDFSCIAPELVGCNSDSAFEHVSVTMEDASRPSAGLVGRNDLPVLERIVRIAMARAAGLRLETATTAVFNGKSVRAFLCRISGRKFVELNGWASSAGWTISLNQAHTVATLTRPGRVILVPLASQWVKVETQWRNLRDVVGEKDGVWYVPDALTSVVAD
jgi:hypothetical protein